MIHRFYVGDYHTAAGKMQLGHEVWVTQPQLVRQWLKVLRLRAGEEVSLFDGEGTERLYRIRKVEPPAVLLELVTDMVPVLPPRKVSLAWSLLKKDKNEWVIQKGTEVGVTHLLPIITSRTVKSGFDKERMRSIAIEAAEQCGRHSIPEIDDPQPLQQVVGEYARTHQLYVADMRGKGTARQGDGDKSVVVFIGPEGGWTDDERALFARYGSDVLGLGSFTLRAETAAITAAHSLLGV